MKKSTIIKRIIGILLLIFVFPVTCGCLTTPFSEGFMFVFNIELAVATVLAFIYLLVWLFTSD